MPLSKEKEQRYNGNAVDRTKEFNHRCNAEKYRLYDYESGKITRQMSLSEMNELLGNIEERIAEFKAESEFAALDRELDALAREKIPEYKKLTIAIR